MTNAEKYSEVFGITPDTKACPTEVCINCPNYNIGKVPHCTDTWWNSEYKGNNND